METYLILEGTDGYGSRKQVLVHEDQLVDSSVEDFFVAPQTFKVAPSVIGKVEVEGDTDKLDEVFEATI
jgi:hypothetical protein